VCSWNVNGRLASEPLDSWLTAGLKGVDALPDLYVIG